MAKQDKNGMHTLCISQFMIILSQLVKTWYKYIIYLDVGKFVCRKGDNSIAPLSYTF